MEPSKAKEFLGKPKFVTLAYLCSERKFRPRFWAHFRRHRFTVFTQKIDYKTKQNTKPQTEKKKISPPGRSVWVVPLLPMEVVASDREKKERSQHQGVGKHTLCFCQNRESKASMPRCYLYFSDLPVL